MADIQQYLDDIMEARYGEEVRGSIHDAIEKINNVSDEAVNSANEALEKAETFIGAAEDAREAAGEARTAAGNANSAASRANQAATTIDESIDQGIDERLEDTLAAAEEAKEAARRANKAAENAGGGLTTESYRILSMDSYSSSSEYGLNGFEMASGETKLVELTDVVPKFREFIRSSHPLDFDLDLITYFVIYDVHITGGIGDGSAGPMVVQNSDVTTFTNSNSPQAGGLFRTMIYNRTNKKKTGLNISYNFMSVQKYVTNTGGISLADLIDEAQSAIKDSQKATQAANDAARSVETAISESETATSAANQAASTANKAIEDLDTSVENVNEALRAATDANTKATQALSDAEEAISSANDAAQSAMSSSDLAIGSAGAASEAADEALRAAEEASKIVDQAASKEYVDQQIDAIEIGGTNLYTGTKDFSGDDWAKTSLEKFDITDEKYMGFSIAKSKMAGFGICQEISAKENESYVFSVYLRSDNGGSEAQLFFAQGGHHDSGEVEPSNKVIKIDSTWKRYYSEFKVLKDCIIAPRVDGRNDSDGNVWVCGIKVERGNKPTDWSPSPYDISSTPEPTSGGEIGGYQLLKGTNNKDSYANREANDDDWANKIMVYTWSAMDSHPSFGKIIDVNDCPNPDVKVGISFEPNTGTAYSVGVTQRGMPFVYNQKYTMSFYAKINRLKEKVFLRGSLLNKNNNYNNIVNNIDFFDLKEPNKWEKISYTFQFDIEPNENAIFDIGFGIINDTTDLHFEMCGFKLELGDTATDWSPNKDDLSSGSNSTGKYTIEQVETFYGTRIKDFLTNLGSNITATSGLTGAKPWYNGAYETYGGSIYDYYTNVTIPPGSYSWSQASPREDALTGARLFLDRTIKFNYQKLRQFKIGNDYIEDIVEVRIYTSFMGAHQVGQTVYVINNSTSNLKLSDFINSEIWLDDCKYLLLKEHSTT